MNRSEAKPAAMGTLAWGEANAGELAAAERCRLLGNLAYVQMLETLDFLGQRLGLLRPTDTPLEALMPPQTALVADALELATTTHQQALILHSWRTYFFGAMLAKQERIEFDKSIFFASAILHDVGLTDDHSPTLCARCFAISGGERVHQYLIAKGHPPELGRNVGDAIALHLNAWVSKRRHGAEAHLLSRGAFCDLFGAGRRRLTQRSLEQVLTRFPRDGVIDALKFETANHRQGTRAAIMTGISGGKAPPDPFQHVSGERRDLRD
ncbi:HD domain-containing protein [Brevundimonas naejangsanensis]|nr:HD domain-containing protein [Brevundimonas naejangsanensis]